MTPQQGPPEPSLGRPNLLAESYQGLHLVDIRRRLKVAEDQIRLVAHDLANGHVYQDIDNRLARDVLDRAASIVSAVKERLVGPE